MLVASIITYHHCLQLAETNNQVGVQLRWIDTKKNEKALRVVPKKERQSDGAGNRTEGHQIHVHPFTFSLRLELACIFCQTGVGFMLYAVLYKYPSRTPGTTRGPHTQYTFFPVLHPIGFFTRLACIGRSIVDNSS